MTWLQTHTGKAFHLDSPAPHLVDINDIAHALSNLCRFGGHSRRFYSVAEHSVLVSQVVPPGVAMQGLLHDATEAYVVDVPRPLKQILGAAYAVVERDVWAAICVHFRLHADLSPAVKRADNTVLLAERNALLMRPPIKWDWAEGLTPAPVEIRCLRPDQAKQLFLDRYYELKLVDYEGVAAL